MDDFLKYIQNARNEFTTHNFTLRSSIDKTANDNILLAYDQMFSKLKPIMEILKPGTKIKTKYGNIEGLIVAARITNEGQAYEISYFYNGEHKLSWLDDFEFTIVDKIEKQIIGFKQ